MNYKINHIMENSLFLGEIKAHTFQSERHCTVYTHTLKLYITKLSVLNKSIISVEDERGEKYQVGVCPATTWKSFYHARNGNGYRYMAGPYYIESLNIDGFENKDIPLHEE